MPEKILIYGSRILARLARDLVDAYPDKVFAGYLNDWEEGPEIVGTLSEVSEQPRYSGHGICPAIGYTDLPARWAAVENTLQANFALASLQHSSAVASVHAQIGSGAILMAQSVVDRGSVLGRANVLWPGAIVNHDCRLGDNVFVSAGCVMAGGSQVGSHSFLGVGATLVNGVKVGSHCFVGAGVLVYDDLPDGTRVVARPNFVRTSP
jgi:sugar O-acyltransferase (sialic acid O-acetyltransferase NeuD family)